MARWKANNVHWTRRNNFWYLKKKKRNKMTKDNKMHVIFFMRYKVLVKSAMSHRNIINSLESDLEWHGRSRRSYKDCTFEWVLFWKFTYSSCPELCFSSWIIEESDSLLLWWTACFHTAHIQHQKETNCNAGSLFRLFHIICDMLIIWRVSCQTTSHLKWHSQVSTFLLACS